MQKGLDRRVLLKVIHPQWAGDPELLERFSREGKAVARVSHHNVVRVFESGWEEGLPYLALEWVEGGTLGERIAGGPLSQAEVKRIAADVLLGLAAVHSVGLLHRDVKPDNIMLTADGTARVTDFSLAGFGRPSALTGHDGIVGSPAYMAPELLDGASPDARSDLYGLGVVLLEALTGSNPFDAGDPLASLARVRSATAPTLSGRPQFDPALAALVDGLLVRDPASRPPSAAAALAIVRGDAENLAPPELRATTTVRRPPPVLIWGLMGTATAAAIIAMLLAGQITPDTRTAAWAIRPLRLPPPASGVGPKPGPRQPTESTAILDSRRPRVADGAIPAIVPLPARLTLIVRPWGELFLDGSPAGATPVGTIELPAGEHTLQLRHPELPGVTRKLVLKPGAADTLRVDLRAEAAAAFVSAAPWGYLWVDGDSVGLLPRDRPVWLEAGTHLLGIANPQYGWWSDSVRVAPGERVSLRVDLPRGTMVATPYSGGN